MLALQVLDPLEAELPKRGDYDFFSAEGGARLKTSTEEIHTAHASAVAARRAVFKRKNKRAEMKLGTPGTPLNS